MLNTAGWLTNGDENRERSVAVKTGQPIVRRVSETASADAFRITGPDGDLSVEVGDRLLRIQETSQIGFYDIQGEGLSDRVAANLNSVVESNIRPRRAFAALEGQEQTRTASVAGRYELWRWLLLAGIVLLLIEWWVWHRRRVI